MNKFLSEILEQPTALAQTLEYYTCGKGKIALEEVKKAYDTGSFERIICTGMGSSYFISHAISTLLNENDIPAFVVNSSELLHYNFSLLKRNTLLICFSQSGESYEIREILDKLPEDVLCVGITNEAESSLAQKSNIALLSMAGTEEMTSTKTYITGTLVAFILGWFLSGKWDGEMRKHTEDFVKNFELNLYLNKEWLDQALDFLGELQSLQIIARGVAFATAKQSALMFKEAVKVPASGMLGGEFRHGPMEMVKPGLKGILFAAKGKTFEQSVQMANDIADFGGKVLLITDVDVPVYNDNIMTIKVAESNENFFAIQSIVPVQLFIDEYAKRRGYEAGSFAIGGKVTIRE